MEKRGQQMAAGNFALAENYSLDLLDSARVDAICMTLR